MKKSEVRTPKAERSPKAEGRRAKPAGGTLQETFYGVEIDSLFRPGQTRLAIGAPGAGPALYYWRRPALEAKRRLRAEGFKRARVVKVQVSFRWS